MSSKGNGYIFRVDRHNTIVEVDSRDAMFNETFNDVCDRKGHLVRAGVVLPSDLHTTPESDEEPPSHDGIIAPPASTRPIPLSNRFEILSDPLGPGSKPAIPQFKDPKPAIVSPTSTVNIPLPHKSTPPSHKHWKFVPDFGPTGKGDRKNDGSKSVSFFQVPDPPQNGPNRRSSRNISLQSSNPALSPTTVLSTLIQSPDKYNPELDILLSCLESKVSPDRCLLSSARTTALHQVFPDGLKGRDPKSQKEIDSLPPAEAKRFNDATLTEFNGMKKKQVMELISLSRIPKDAKIYPSVVNWTTKKVLGVY